MATTQTKRLTRDELAQFLPTQRAIKAFEDLTEDVGTVLPDNIEINAAAIEELRSISSAMEARIAIALAQRLDLRAGANVTILLDAAGYTISASGGGGGGAVDDSENILANNIFGV